MILPWMIVILLAAGIAAWIVDRRGSPWPRWIVLAAAMVDLGIAIGLCFRHAAPGSAWLEEFNVAWIPQFGIRFHLALDGLSLVLLLLTFFLGIVAVLGSWRETQQRAGFFHFNIAFVLAGITAVFLAMDLFLFYFAWELMLVPMYFLIAIWGHERRSYASIKFFLFTQISGLLMLVSILTLAFLYHSRTGVYSYDYSLLRQMPLSPAVEFWIMLGFFVAFVVKLPMVPLHTWLPDAHTEAPTAGSVILAGLMLKTGAYGLMRFVVVMFPDAARTLAPAAMILAVAGILYGAILAFSQTDLKRMVAYTSVSHLGFVLLGVFAWNALALQGALLQIVCHGLSTGALFAIAGALQDRMHTRDLGRMRGLWTAMPRMGAVGLFFAMASLGLPGLGNFVAEFLILFGSFPVSRVLTILAAGGMIAAMIYSLQLVQRVFHGTNAGHWQLADMGAREAAMFAPMIGILVWLGLYPQPLFNAFAPVLALWSRTVAPAAQLFLR